MPWTCPACGAEVTLDSVLVCPGCKRSKTSWTLAAERTRTLVIPTKKRLEGRRGRLLATAAASPAPHLATAWPLTTEASVLTKDEARALAAARLQPRPEDLLCVRLRPAKTARQWRLRLTTLFEARRAEELTLDYDPAPERLGPDEAFDAHFVCVHGPGDLAGLRFPGVHVLDVTDDTPLGHAPRLEVAAQGKPTPIDLVARRERLECLRGRLLPTTPTSPAPHLAVAWRRTAGAAALTKAAARDLAGRRLLPRPEDLLRVRLTPDDGAPAWSLRLAVPFATRPPADLTLEYEAAPGRLDEAGAFTADFVCVHGPGGLEGIAFPTIFVLDVTDDAPPGHAPRLEVSAPGARPVSVALGGDAP